MMPQSVSLVSAGVPCDKAERSKHIYLGFMYTGGRLGWHSNNKGLSWVRTTDLGAQTGLNTSLSQRSP